MGSDVPKREAPNRCCLAGLAADGGRCDLEAAAAETQDVRTVGNASLVETQERDVLWA
jgi:hypothetical protein